MISRSALSTVWKLLCIAQRAFFEHYHNVKESSVSNHICKFPSRYSLAYSSGSSMASVFNAQSDPGLYSANIVLIVSYLLIVQSIICYKNQKHFNQFTMSLLFCVILFYIIFLVSAAASVGTEQMSTGHLVPLYFPLSEFVNTGGTI